MANLATIPVYFSGFSPVLSFAANMGSIDCRTELDNSEGAIIKDGSIITYDWNDPTKIKVQNGDEIKTITLNFYQNGGSSSGTLIENPKSVIKGRRNMLISTKNAAWNSTNPFYANNDCLKCEVLQGDVGEVNGGHNGEIGANPPKNNTNYGGWYEEYVYLLNTDTYKLKFTRTKMTGSFTITVNYTGNYNDGIGE